MCLCASVRSQSEIKAVKQIEKKKNNRVRSQHGRYAKHGLLPILFKFDLDLVLFSLFFPCLSSIEMNVIDLFFRGISIIYVRFSSLISIIRWSLFSIKPLEHHQKSIISKGNDNESYSKSACVVSLSHRRMSFSACFEVISNSSHITQLMTYYRHFTASMKEKMLNEPKCPMIIELIQLVN